MSMSRRDAPRSTEWDDIHRKFRGEKTVTEEWEEAEQAALEQQQVLQAIMEIERLENATIDELDEMEDEMDEDVFDSYRQQRMEEMRKEVQRNKFGSVFRIGQTDYTATVACKGEHFVVCLLYGSDPCSARLQHYVTQLAPRFKDVKFVEIAATAAIPNYPAKNAPTLLVYYDGEQKEAIVGPLRLGGNQVTADEFEYMLGQRKIIKTKVDPEKKRRGRGIFGRMDESDPDESDSEYSD
ncbi:phosducin [Carpediemonas membranifera]|nr:phosducin [Carpediemonas membranifera]|eukprot:KAG9397285.1 phosducin [Carpediemonas membranifera]